MLLPLSGFVTAKTSNSRTSHACSAGQQFVFGSHCFEPGSSFSGCFNKPKSTPLGPRFNLELKEEALMRQPDESGYSARPHDHATLAEALRRSRMGGIVAPPDGLFSDFIFQDTTRTPRNAWLFRIAFALPVAAAVAFGIVFFAFRDRGSARASEALSQSLSVLSNSGSEVTDFVLQPVRHEAGALVQQTRRATASFKRVFPRLY